MLKPELADCIRMLAADAVQRASSGHPGMPMGMAEAGLVLFARNLKYDASKPDWPDRDRFILSNGHGSMLQYAVLHLTGYPRMSMAQLRRFRQLGSCTPGHPEYGCAPGIEATTGPLGQGLAAGVGMAAAEEILAAEFGTKLVNHRTWVFVGDGCLMEGVGQEAASLAGHLGLGKLVAVFDDNSITIDGATDLSRSEDVGAKMAASGWEVQQADGHDIGAVSEAFARAARGGSQPQFVALRTVIGKGSPNKAGQAAVHGAPLGAEEVAATRTALGWKHGPFCVPEKLLAQWRGFGLRGRAQRRSWEARVAAAPAAVRKEFLRRLKRSLPAGLAGEAAAFRRKIAAQKQTVATRKAGNMALQFYARQLPELVGGSADLTASNLSRTGEMKTFVAGRPGNYFHYGVREFAMGAAVNGMFLHGGLRPYGSTFLVFSDYMRGALRLAALMRIGSIFVLSHDSIGLGEDGPTHQPVEHLASLRAIPNLRVLRPADVVETLECWELALECAGAPSVLALSRQGVPVVRLSAGNTNRCARGAYVLNDPGDRDLTILSTGSEVHLAVQAAAQLAKEGLRTAVVSMPCWELFDLQPRAYRAKVLGSAPRIAVEAGCKFGWARYVGADERVIGLECFGESAPAADVFYHCGITTKAVIALGKKVARKPART